MFGQRRHERPSASSPHEFVEPPDPRLGLAFGSGASTMGALGNASAVSVTGATVGDRPCALAGCGKLRDDAIHMVGDGE